MTLNYKINIEDLDELKESLTKLATDLKAVSKAVDALDSIDADELIDTVNEFQNMLKKAKVVEEE